MFVCPIEWIGLDDEIFMHICVAMSIMNYMFMKISYVVMPCVSSMRIIALNLEINVCGMTLMEDLNVKNVGRVIIL